jgi:hypothetical protein
MNQDLKLRYMAHSRRFLTLYVRLPDLGEILFLFVSRQGSEPTETDLSWVNRLGYACDPLICRGQYSVYEEESGILWR